MSLTHQYITEHTLLKEAKVFRYQLLNMVLQSLRANIALADWVIVCQTEWLPWTLQWLHYTTKMPSIEALSRPLVHLAHIWSTCVNPWDCQEQNNATLAKNNTPKTTQSWLSSWGVQTAAAVKVTPKPSGHASTSCFPWSWLQGRQWHWSSYRCH